MKEEINKLVITKNTLKKIRDYSELVCKKEDIECYGFLLNPKDKKDHVVYNAILACGQEVTETSVKVGSIGLLDSKAEIENLGYDAIGCWHSHHSIGAWHSSIDDSNLEKLVSSIASNREVAETRTLPEGYFLFKETSNELLIREGGIEIIIKSSKPIDFSHKPYTFNQELYYGYTKGNKLFVNINGRTIFLNIDEHTMSFKRSETEKLTAVGFAYSLVVSGKKTYAELATKKTCNICEKGHIEKRPVEIKIIEPEKDINFTRVELEDEIKRKVKINKKFLILR